MDRILYWGAILVSFVIFADKSYCLDITAMADQSSLRCSGGVVAIGDSERDVQEKCGEPQHDEDALRNEDMNTTTFWQKFLLGLAVLAIIGFGPLAPAAAETAGKGKFSQPGVYLQ